MRSAGILDKLDDMFNPIAVKELRQAVKSRIVISALMLFLLIQLAILLLSLWFDDRPTGDSINLHAGREIFQILQGFLLGTCMLLVPGYAGVRLAAEHSDTNVDLLFISTLRPRGIIAGKLQASIVLILLIFSACAPFMTFTYLLRGIDIPSILILLVLDFLVVLLSTQVAIFLGSVPANAALKLILGLLGLSVLGLLFGYTVLYSILMLNSGLGSRLDSIEFWLTASAVLVTIVAVIGLLFTWSVAIVSPPSSNRALPVRFYLLGFWLLTGGMAALLAYQFRFAFLIDLWMGAMAGLLCAHLLVTINERERWGWRVERMIPRRWWLRVPLFLLFSGSAGGLLFTIILLALTIALPNLVLEHWSGIFTSSLGRFVFEINRRNSIALVLMALYTFDYCMLAVWLRYSFLSKWIKPGATWTLAMILAGVGLLLPYPLLFLFQNEELRLGRLDPWWQISNPYPTIITCTFARNVESVNFRVECIGFLSGLGLLLLLGCLPWMIRQMRQFRPAAKEAFVT
jgi:hypothetical protein